LGGHRGDGIYGQLACAAAAHAIAKGGYIENRVFFADANDAVACGYRPCATCLPKAHRAWKERITLEPQDGASAGVAAGAAVHWFLELNATVVSIGHGRSDLARSIAETFEQRWSGLGRLTPHEPFARDVGAVVDWPRRAASWLRPARRLADGTADHWFVADRLDGLVPVARRLRSDTEWDPSRTIAVVVGAPTTTSAPPGAAVLAGLRMVTFGGHRGTVTVDGCLQFEP
jgi:hypothetical protein